MKSDARLHCFFLIGKLKLILLIHIGFCLNMLVCHFHLLLHEILHGCVRICGAVVLLWYGRVCLGAFKHQHYLAKIA